ncbi:MAG: PP2C family protein-serine/threonine phosphatase [bacterium]|jgi:serine phosphatase RsbU (regulator of sigma subunit)|nr:PP2C family protein-serine/threonine phosphatase [candidate division KSB1 bacterium]MDH7560512.1 PP2C family protein-serine/threonine phosphatase [bacterium]
MMERAEKKRQLLIDGLIGVAALLGLSALLLWHRDIFPWGGRTVELSKDEAVRLAQTVVDGLGIDVSRYRRSVSFRGDQSQLRYLARRFGPARANRFAKGWIPAYRWQVEWHPIGRVEQVVLGMSRSAPPEQFRESRPIGGVQVRLAEDGRLLSCRALYADTARGASLSQGEAESLAMAVARRQLGAQFEQFDLQSVEPRHAQRRLDYLFRWVDRDRPAGEQVEYSVEIAGDKVAGYGFEYKVPPVYADSPGLVRAIWVPTVLFYVGMTVLVLFVLIKKLRADEITFRPGLVFALLGAVALSTRLMLAQHEQWLLEVVVVLLLSLPLVAPVLLVLVSVADSMAREVWPAKLLSLDALRAGRFAHRHFGLAMARGVAVGAFAAGLGVTLLKGASLLTSFHFINIPLVHQEVTAAVPGLYALSHVVLDALFVTFALVLFLPSFLVRSIANRGRVVLVAGAVWMGGLIGSGEFAVWPCWPGALVKLAVAAVILGTFVRFDFLTAAIGHLSLGMLIEGASLVSAASRPMYNSGVAMLVVVVVAGGMGLALSRRQGREAELAQLAPSYARRMNERLRLQRELEVARRVQLSFLPRVVPQIPGLEIATTCIAATEVGGDYYDFVTLGPQQLGAAIGDVSGKGISAAFYMTLTKGFFRSQARALQSPREVLIRVNELFCENAERGHFVSMVYGIFDMKRRVFRFARAGHNPIVLGRAQGGHYQALCPKGIALGLTNGPLFAQVIDEEEAPLRPGDCFVFYTDGFTEAMDRRNEEFGEQRLYALVAEHAGSSPRQLVQVIERRVRAFVGGMPQHDDMTMVVVRVGS